MRGKKVKEIRKALGFDFKSPQDIQRRVYRRVKRQYSTLPNSEREGFVDKIHQSFH
jgi:hypothetical protein